MPLAYALRLELQLMNKRNDRQNEQLERVELTIRQLERLNEPFYTKATRWLWDRFVEKSTEEPLPPIYEEAESPLTVSQDKEDT